MLTCDHPKFMYFAPGKTGTRSLVNVFQRMLKLPVYQLNGGTHSHPTPEQLEERKDHAMLITTRNPYSRAVSLWSHYKHKRPPADAVPTRVVMWQVTQGTTFRDWLEILKSREPVDWISHGHLHQHFFLDAMPRVDYRIRQEHYAEDVLSLPFVPDTLELPKLNVSQYHKQQAWQDYDKDPAVTELVRELWAKDLQVLGYDMDPLKG